MVHFAFRAWLLAFALCIGGTVVCVYYIDRPAAEYFNLHLRHTGTWTLLNHFLAPLKLVPVAALFFLLGSGGWLISGRRLSPWTSKPLLCSWSVVWALTGELVLKEIFGRGWPDPTYIENHLYGFRFLHSSEHWTSFPSGTAMGSCALAATLWMTAPRYRLAYALVAGLICVAVTVTNGHWVSDAIAGAFLGVSMGWMTVLLHRSGNNVK